MEDEDKEYGTPVTVNCFLIDGKKIDLILIATTESFFVLDIYHSIKQRIWYSDILAVFDRHYH